MLECIVDKLLPLAWLALVAALGIWCLLAPDHVLLVRRRFRLSNSILSGGYFYATRDRIRRMGVVWVIVAVLAGLALFHGQ